MAEAVSLPLKILDGAVTSIQAADIATEGDGATAGSISRALVSSAAGVGLDYYGNVWALSVGGTIGGGIDIAGGEFAGAGAGIGLYNFAPVGFGFSSTPSAEVRYWGTQLANFTIGPYIEAGVNAGVWALQISGVTGNSDPQGPGANAIQGGVSLSATDIANANGTGVTPADIRSLFFPELAALSATKGPSFTPGVDTSGVSIDLTNLIAPAKSNGTSNGSPATISNPVTTSAADAAAAARAADRAAQGLQPNGTVSGAPVSLSNPVIVSPSASPSHSSAPAPDLSYLGPVDANGLLIAPTTDVTPTSGSPTPIDYQLNGLSLIDI